MSDKSKCDRIFRSMTSMRNAVVSTVLTLDQMDFDAIVQQIN